MVKVILLKNVKGYGQIGDIKNAADGYAKNYLLPNKIAKPVTPGALRERLMLCLKWKRKMPKP
ncbi:MAG: 50S ribosomal protein L9 [Candidatus Yanofskybacteria bacterium GW2011_GWD2_39_48]|uniref:50S ribosomal protein L9 n=1 Tax=Candidatus Yanofskybacteria bacterium GW2011_GWD2_39_48 TaxID=1619031 RepID=A0A0G0SE70_9BACT|nr:MAG: 50S ribosomal protein L9 [Candidatus Yanofskybacteria bacterium GW2011_GWD2_39_48]